MTSNLTTRKDGEYANARVFYPQCAINCTATIQLSRTVDRTTTVNFLAYPQKAEWISNPFDEADELRVTLDAQRFPVLPRLIRQLHVQFYGGDAGGIDQTNTVVDDSFIRFIGYADDPELSLSETTGDLTFKARDYTALLIDAKNPPTTLVPRWEQSLFRALRNILDNLPGGENITLILGTHEAPESLWPMMKDGAPAGVTKGALPAKPTDTLWTLVKRACDPLGLIPRIHLDQLIVAPSRGFRIATRGAFIAGKTVTKYTEKRLTTRIREGIGLRAYNPISRSMMTGLYPPLGDAAIQKTHRHAAKKKATPPLVPGSGEKRLWFQLHESVQSQEILDAKAQFIYESRSMQELSGSFESSRMLVESDDPSSASASTSDVIAEDFDVTAIESGDQVTIDVNLQDRQLLADDGTTAERVQRLEDAGYDGSVAAALVAAYEASAEAALAVYVRKATHLYSVDDPGYNLMIEYQNLISETGE